MSLSLFIIDFNMSYQMDEFIFIQDNFGPVSFDQTIHFIKEKTKMSSKNNVLGQWTLANNFIF